MNVNTVINLVLIGILVICAWQGYKKGIIMGIIEVLVIILSLYGAQLLTDTYSSEVIPVMKPFVSGYMENQVESATFTAFGYEPDSKGQFHTAKSMTDMLIEAPERREEIALATYKNQGIYDSMAQTLAERTVKYADDNNASLLSAVTNVSCQTLSWYGGLLLAFIILFTIMIVLVNLPNLSFKLPYVGIVNDIGGIGIGIFVGCLFCSVVVWVLQFAGLLLPEDTLRATGLASFFLDKNMLANYISF